MLNLDAITEKVLKECGDDAGRISKSADEVAEVLEREIKSGSTSFKVGYNGGESPIYRGGNNFTVKSNEVKINPQTGNVKTSHGVSLDVNPETVSKFGGCI